MRAENEVREALNREKEMTDKQLIETCRHLLITCGAYEYRINGINDGPAYGARLLFSTPNRIAAQVATFNMQQLETLAHDYPDLLEDIIKNCNIDRHIATRLRRNEADYIFKYVDRSNPLTYREYECLYYWALNDKLLAEYIFSQPCIVLNKIFDKKDHWRLIEFVSKYPELIRKLEKRGLSEGQRAAIAEALPLERGRTQHIFHRNRFLVEHDTQWGVHYNGIFVPQISRKIQDFDQPLCYALASEKNEVLVLDPRDQLYEDMYQQLKHKIAAFDDLGNRLNVLMNYTKECFPLSDAEQFAGNVFEGRKDKANYNVALAEFIIAGTGESRHHALLNSYFISRLIKDGLLQGKMAYHGEDLGGKDASWSLFLNAVDSKIYAIDSLRGQIFCLSARQAGKLNQFYTIGKTEIPVDIEAGMKKHFSEMIFRPEFSRGKVGLFKSGDPSKDSLDSESPREGKEFK